MERLKVGAWLALPRVSLMTKSVCICADVCVCERLTSKAVACSLNGAVGEL